MQEHKQAELEFVPRQADPGKRGASLIDMTETARTMQGHAKIKLGKDDFVGSVLVKKMPTSHKQAIIPDEPVYSIC